LSRFFIDRPIFAWVVAIVVMLAGGLSILGLPISQYPNVALPQVTISAVYPGASAKTVEDSVTQVIEQKMKGLDGLLYISSTSDGSGASQITLTFEAATDPDIAQVQVQNKLQTATALLPQEVQKQGLSVTKSAMNFLMVIALYSKDGSVSELEIGDFIASKLQDPISRVDGVGDVQMFSSQLAMRIWLDPAKLAALSLTPSDVADVVTAQNAQVSAGALGAAPAVAGTTMTATISAQSRLQTVEEFRNIVLKTDAGGAAVRLGDVARVELGQESYSSVGRYNGQPAGGMAIKLATGANALDTSKAVKAQLEALSATFPEGVVYDIPQDGAPFVEKSIQEVIKTLAEAILLVVLVMFVFLQNWRATLIPAIAVPVVLLGVFGVLAVFGYSINTLTMLALVLAIGLLVDDAIVVVENVERVMTEEGLSPREATRKSMGEISSALIGIALVLSAVFVPMAFFGGSQGVIYRQFSVTIVSAMLLSVLVALVLTPALCATLLKPVAKGEHHHTRGFFAWFNRNFDRTAKGYETWVSRFLGHGRRGMAAFVVVIIGVGLLFMQLPTSFLPEEDQGELMVLVQLPPGATQERTLEVLDRVEQQFLGDKAVHSIFTVGGFSFAGAGENAGMGFIRLKDFGDRKAGDMKAPAVAGRAMQAFMGYRDAQVFAIVPPAVQELGTASGFNLQLKDEGGLGHEALIAARNQLLGMAAQDPRLSGVRPNGLDDTAQLKIDIDTAKAGALGLSLADINANISAAFGGAYVNDFIDEGRVKKVYMQAEPEARMQPEDLALWHVRNADGQMIPFSAFGSATWIQGSPRLERYNGAPSINIQGGAAPGRSTGEAMDAMEEIIAKLPPGIGYEWTGISLQEREAGGQAPALYALSVLVIFLLLAALYESWTVPLAVILAIPLGVFGALLATSLRGLSNDIYFQVGMLTTMGLTAKNAILIVEFAKDMQARGMELVAATLQAVRVRLRPILMTSLAFTFGVTPLAISNGAGSGSHHAIGTGVIGGVVAGTAMVIFFVPLFYVLIQRLAGRRAAARIAARPDPAEAH
jgi:multidrug efflux pump